MSTVKSAVKAILFVVIALAAVKAAQIYIEQDEKRLEREYCLKGYLHASQNHAQDNKQFGTQACDCALDKIKKQGTTFRKLGVKGRVDVTRYCLGHTILTTAAKEYQAESGSEATRVVDNAKLGTLCVKQFSLIAGGKLTHASLDNASQFCACAANALSSAVGSNDNIAFAKAITGGADSCDLHGLPVTID